LVIFFILFIIVAYMYLPDFETMTILLRESPLDILKKVGLLLLALVFVIIFNTKGITGLYKSQYKANREMQQKHKIKVGSQWISIMTDSNNLNISKSHIKRIIYDKDAIYIYEKKNSGHILKKQFLENEEDFDELVNFIKLNYDY